MGLRDSGGIVRQQEREGILRGIRWLLGRRRAWLEGEYQGEEREREEGGGEWGCWCNSNGNRRGKSGFAGKGCTWSLQLVRE